MEIEIFINLVSFLVAITFHYILCSHLGEVRGSADLTTRPNVYYVYTEYSESPSLSNYKMGTNVSV